MAAVTAAALSFGIQAHAQYFDTEDIVEESATSVRDTSRHHTKEDSIETAFLADSLQGQHTLDSLLLAFYGKNQSVEFTALNDLDTAAVRYHPRFRTRYLSGDSTKYTHSSRLPTTTS